MANCFCTIITYDHIPFAQVLYKNLLKFQQADYFSVLIVDSKGKPNFDFRTYSISDLEKFSSEDIKKLKKYNKNVNSIFRWALKPLFLKFLIQEKDYDNLIYVDPDIHFYNDPGFLFELLDTSDILITPHWRSKDPFLDLENFEQLFTGGIYNAGFLACNQNALNILDWWLKVCSYKMIKDKGMYVDQAFLNLMPVYFSKQVKIVEHKGCNVAGWNLIECKRIKKNGSVVINEEYPIVFIHFTPGTVSGILSGDDSLLASYLQRYKEAIRAEIPNFSFRNQQQNKSSGFRVFNLFGKK